MVSHSNGLDGCILLADLSDYTLSLNKNGHVVQRFSMDILTKYNITDHVFAFNKQQRESLEIMLHTYKNVPPTQAQRLKQTIEKDFLTSANRLI